MGIGIAVSYIGTIIAQNLGAWIAQVSDWQVTIRFFAAIVSLGGAVFFLFYRGKPASEAEAALKGEGKASQKSDKAKHRSVYLTPSVWMLCLLVIFACEEGLVDSFAVIQMGELWGTDAVQFAWILSFGMILAIFVNLGAGWCGDRFGNWNMLIATGLLNSMVGVCLLVGQFNMKSIYITGILIAKALQLTTTLFVNSLAPTFLGGRDVGPIIAIIFLGSGLGQYFGPQVIGILKDTTGAYTIGWIYIAACGVMSVLISFGFKIYFERKES
jgi:MFS family permease